jgi:hypothetical protein
MLTYTFARQSQSQLLHLLGAIRLNVRTTAQDLLSCSIVNRLVIRKPCGDAAAMLSPIG